MQNKELYLFDYLKILYKRKTFIIYSSLIISIIAVIIALVLPKWYKAEAVVMPGKIDMPFESSGMLSMTSLFNEISESKRYLAILKSRTTLERIINIFNLQKIYETKNIEETIKELKSNSDFSIDEEGPVRVTVLDKSPERAAGMANEFVAILDETNKNLNLQNPNANIKYIRERINKNLDSIKVVEKEFKSFQEKYNIVALPEQTEAMIQTAAELYAQIKMIEIELTSQESTLGKGHATIRSLKTTLNEYRNKLNELMTTSEISVRDPKKKELSKLFVPMSELPAVEMQYIELKRNMQAQHKIYELLVEYLEIARLLKSNKTSELQILDSAVPPGKKYKPKRAVIVLISGFSAFIISSLLVLYAEYYKFKTSQYN